MSNGPHGMERWLSGRKRFPAKEVYPLKGIEGSNPSLSDSLNCVWKLKTWVHQMSEKFQPTLPQSKESEMMVLGCMLTSSSALSIASDALNEDDFYYPEHKSIFFSLKLAFTSEKPADVHLIAENLKNRGKYQEVGGVAYLTTLVQFVGTSAYVEEYVDIVKKKAILRQMIHASKETEKRALTGPDDVYSALDEAQELFFKISQKANSTIGVEMKDILSGVKATTQLPYLKELQQKQELFHQHDGNLPLITGISTGFCDLDRLTNGLSPSNLIIIAGRPSMGKTAIALNMAQYVAVEKNVPVGIFSLEMMAEELLHRVICSQAEIESEKLKTGSLDGYEYQKVVEAVNRLKEHTMIIDDQPGLKITDLRARARRMKEVHGIGFLVIDYLQLLSGAKGYYNSDNRQNEISEISRMLKNLARELEIPILCGSQLSRKVEERAGHRPMLSDLRESGSIEQDADIVMLMFRRDYYNPNDKPGMAEVIIAKNRHGQVGDVQLTFRKKFAQFKNYIQEGNSDSSESSNRSAYSAFTP